MAGKTCTALINVSVYVFVVIGQFCRIIVFVAVNTTECTKVARRQMAVGATVPLAIMLTTVNGEVHAVMIKCRWRPGIHRMTGLTVRREACAEVIGIIGAVVFLLVAAETGIGCIVVIAPYMTGRAVIGNGGMRTEQGIKIIVIEERWNPAVLRMATHTIGRKLCC